MTRQPATDNRQPTTDNRQPTNTTTRQHTTTTGQLNSSDNKLQTCKLATCKQRCRLCRSSDERRVEATGLHPVPCKLCVTFFVRIAVAVSRCCGQRLWSSWPSSVVACPHRCRGRWPSLVVAVAVVVAGRWCVLVCRCCCRHLIVGGGRLWLSLVVVCVSRQPSTVRCWCSRCDRPAE